MTKLYKITPLEKNSAQHFIEVYRKNSKGLIKGWRVTETYRWGEGFREMDDPVTKSQAKSKVICDPNIGAGADLRDGSTVDFEYDDSVSKKERVQIEKEWEEGDGEGMSGSSYLLGTSEHGWEIEEESIIILGPVRIDIVEENDDGDVIILETNASPLAADGESEESELIDGKSFPSEVLAAVFGAEPTTETEVITKLMNWRPQI